MGYAAAIFLLAFARLFVCEVYNRRAQRLVPFAADYGVPIKVSHQHRLFTALQNDIDYTHPSCPDWLAAEYRHHKSIAVIAFTIGFVLVPVGLLVVKLSG